MLLVLGILGTGWFNVIEIGGFLAGLLLKNINHLYNERNQKIILQNKDYHVFS